MVSVVKLLQQLCCRDRDVEVGSHFQVFSEHLGKAQGLRRSLSRLVEMFFKCATCQDDGLPVKPSTNAIYTEDIFFSSLGFCQRLENGSQTNKLYQPKFDRPTGAFIVQLFEFFVYVAQIVLVL